MWILYKIIQWWIQDLPDDLEVGATSNYFGHVLPENCMKMNKNGQRGGTRP